MRNLFKIAVLFLGIMSMTAQNNLTESDVDSIAKTAVEKYGFNASKTQFMIRGYGHTGFASTNENGEKVSSFDGGTFAPIFLFKHTDRFMFESELEFSLSEGELEVGFEYANIMYVINDYVTVRAGKFLLPFGTFMERLHPSWINKFTSKPLGFGHDGIAPSSDVGVELRGAFYIGNTKWNYAGYVTNGPKLKDGSIEPDEAGMLSFENLIDNNRSKAFGGRIGFLPFSDSSLEVGFSALNTSGVGDEGSDYENVGAFLYALDLSYVKLISPIGGIIDIKGQYNNSKVDEAVYYDDIEDETYTFENKSNSYYIQLSYKPIMAGSNFVKNLEIVGRYAALNTPEEAKWESQSTQTSIGLNYWLSWRSLIKVSYETMNLEGGHDADGNSKIKTFAIHWAIGF